MKVAVILLSSLFLVVAAEYQREYLGWDEDGMRISVDRPSFTQGRFIVTLKSGYGWDLDDITGYYMMVIRDSCPGLILYKSISTDKRSIWYFPPRASQTFKDHCRTRFKHTYVVAHVEEDSMAYIAMIKNMTSFGSRYILRNKFPSGEQNSGRRANPQFPEGKLIL